MADKKVGEVSHYFDHIQVAIVEVKSPFKVGDNLKFMKHGEELFQQAVASIQEEHKQLDKAVKGQSVGVKVDQKVHEGVEVYKI